MSGTVSTIFCVKKMLVGPWLLSRGYKFLYFFLFVALSYVFYFSW